MKGRSIVVAVIVVALVGTAIYFSPPMREARFVDSLITRNLEARGGADAWENVSAMRMAGQMDLGQEMIVPYVLEQKRPGKMCFEFEFDDATSTQCTDGQQGWKIVPFMGRSEPVAMTELEYREMADSVDPYGLLYDYKDRGLTIEYLGIDKVDERETHKLQVNMPHGGVRWLYLDAENGLDVMLKTLRTVVGREFLVETRYTDWREVEGLLIPVRQESRTEGDADSHFLTVDSITVNPQIDDDRFHIPAVVSVNGSGSGGNPS
jgi:hypothetical protein